MLDMTNLVLYNVNHVVANALYDNLTVLKEIAERRLYGLSTIHAKLTRRRLVGIVGASSAVDNSVGSVLEWCVGKRVGNI